MRALSAKKPVKLRNPNAIRPWQHVLEPLSGLLLITSKLILSSKKFSGPWNLGPVNSNLSVNELVSEIIKQWGGEKYSISRESKSHHEAMTLRLDSSKAFNMLGWKPAYSIHESIKVTTDWYRCYYENRQNIEELSVEQIKQYCMKSKTMNIHWSQ